MTTIYDKHRKAFPNVTAGVLVKDGEKIGTLAFKFPKDGAGRLTCFLHIHGWPMVSGTASGYGYDKKTAAFESACNFLDPEVLENYPFLNEVNTNGVEFSDYLKANGVQYWGAV